MRMEDGTKWFRGSCSVEGFGISRSKLRVLLQRSGKFKNLETCDPQRAQSAVPCSDVSGWRNWIHSGQID
jgi:hypothetical protein